MEGHVSAGLLHGISFYQHELVSRHDTDVNFTQRDETHFFFLCFSIYDACTTPFWICHRENSVVQSSTKSTHQLDSRMIFLFTRSFNPSYKSMDRSCYLALAWLRGCGTSSWLSSCWFIPPYQPRFPKVLQYKWRLHKTIIRDVHYSVVYGTNQCSIMEVLFAERLPIKIWSNWVWSASITPPVTNVNGRVPSHILCLTLPIIGSV